MKIKLLCDWGAFRKGAVIEQDPCVADGLIRTNRAEEVKPKTKRVGKAPRNKAVKAAGKVTHGTE